jgi:hypothetical protein
MDYDTQLFFTFQQKKDYILKLQHHKFHIDQCVIEYMKKEKICKLKTFLLHNWKNFYHLHVNIQAVNTKALQQQYQHID